MNYNISTVKSDESSESPKMSKHLRLKEIARSQ